MLLLSAGFAVIGLVIGIYLTYARFPPMKTSSSSHWEASAQPVPPPGQWPKRTPLKKASQAPRGEGHKEVSMSFTAEDIIRPEVGFLLRGDYRRKFLCSPCLVALAAAEEDERAGGVPQETSRLTHKQRHRKVGEHVGQ